MTDVLIAEYLLFVFPFPWPRVVVVNERAIFWRCISDESGPFCALTWGDWFLISEVTLTEDCNVSSSCGLASCFVVDGGLRFRIWLWISEVAIEGGIV